ncbi:MAG: hypothetical protein LQ340_003079, partial [Diploschistes diacapsis]
MDTLLEDFRHILKGQGCSLISLLETHFNTSTFSIALLHVAPDISTITLNCETHTLFQACSISKPLAATTAFRAIQAGRLSLSDPITKHLTPAQTSLLCSSPSHPKLLPHITISHLLSHTSGLSQGGFPGYTTPSSSTSIPDLQALLAGTPPSNTPRIHPLYLPGQQSSYSGGAYCVLQLILQNIFQEPYADIVRSLVLAPLRMTHSTFSPRPEDQGHKVAPPFWTGTLPVEHGYHVQPEQAAAGLWTTPSDLMRLVNAVREAARGGRGANQPFLSRELARRMLEE